MNKSSKILKINQTNVFYNYTLGFKTGCIDLVKTAAHLIKKGISKAVFFSDQKFVYIDESGKMQFELLTLEGRQWDSSKKYKFSPKVPQSVILDLFHSLEISFHEERLACSSTPYLRAALPPFILQDDVNQMPLFVSIKIYSDGIAILSFQFDGTWDGINENDFISDIVNIFKKYFQSIWIDSRIQAIDAEVSLPNAFNDITSFSTMSIKGRKIKKLIKTLRNKSRKVLEDSLSGNGENFKIGDDNWLLHRVAGSENYEHWESTVDLCRLIYSDAISAIIVPHNESKKIKLREYMWEGRPSISLLRFKNQPQNKNELIQIFSQSMKKILLRGDAVDNTYDFTDLRMFEDFCFHGNRSVLLWTWLKPRYSSKNIWRDPNTPSMVVSNQAIAEYIEYHNMNLLRACSWAHNPSTNDNLLAAYKVLSTSNMEIRNSSNAGEISNTLSYLIESFGTAGLVPSAKDAAKFYLDELRYKTDVARNRSNRWLTFVFGLVGITSFAEFVIHPFIKDIFPMLGDIKGPVLSFSISAIFVLLIVIIIWVINKNE